MNATEKSEFLWDALRYFEGRITMVDSKAAIIIAIQTGFLALVAVMIDHKTVQVLAPLTRHMALSAIALFTGAIVSLLLQAIRPVRFWLSLKAKIPSPHSDKLLWPDKRPNRTAFMNRVASLSPELLLEDLKDAVFVRHQLLRRKYRAYELALLLTKIEVLGLTVFALVFAVSQP